MAVVYVPRSPRSGVLYDVVRRHLAAFLTTVDAQADGSGLPGSVVSEFREFPDPICVRKSDLGQSNRDEHDLHRPTCT
ncbi:MAG: hypothetical protein U0807_18825 [Candidatus Binatia bacterium]